MEGAGRKVFMLVVLSEMAFATTCMANGLMREVMGSVQGGRGGTDVAYPGNGMSVYDNPAALTELKGRMAEIDFDVLNLMPVFDNDHTRNNDKGGDVWVALPALSYAQQVNDRIGLGVGLYTPAGCKTEYVLEHPIFGNVDYSSYATLSELLISGSYRLIDSVSIGLGIGPAYSKEKIHEPYTFQTGPVAGLPVLLDLKADATGFTWNIGLQWRAAKGTIIGLVYHPERKFNLEGDLKLDLQHMNDLLPLMGAQSLPNRVAYYDVEYDLVWPQTAAIGIMRQVTDALTLSAELTWYGWENAFDKLEFKLSHSSNPYYNAAVGTSAPRDTLPLDWDNAYSVKVGGEYALTKNDTVRLGYIYEDNPIPDSTLTPIIPAIYQHEIDAGYSRSWENWTASISYGHVFGPSQHVRVSGLVDAARQYDDSTIDFSARFVSIGAQYRF